MKVTNTQKGPRGLNTKDGLVLVEPGETVDVELEAAERKVAEGTGWFELGEDAEDGGSLSSLTIPELKALAASEGVDLGDASKKTDIIAAIELAREDAA